MKNFVYSMQAPGDLQLAKIGPIVAVEIGGGVAVGAGVGPSSVAPEGHARRLSPATASTSASVTPAPTTRGVSERARDGACAAGDG